MFDKFRSAEAVPEEPQGSYLQNLCNDEEMDEKKSDGIKSFIHNIREDIGPGEVFGKKKK